MSLSSPTSARPVARIRLSPFSVKGSSVLPVCRPLSDHSVSPCRMMKARGVVIVAGGGGGGGGNKYKCGGGGGVGVVGKRWVFNGPRARA